MPVLKYTTLNEDFRTEFPAGRTILHHAAAQSEDAGLETSEQIQVVSVQKWSLKTFTSNKKPNILQPVSLQLSPLSPHAAPLGRAKLWSKGERAKESLGQNEYRLHLAIWWKVLVTACLEVKILKVRAQEELKPDLYV